MRSYEIDVGGDDYTSAGGGALQGGIAVGSVNTAAIAEQSHNLLAFGTSIGTIEFWDARSRGRAAILHLPSACEGIRGKQEVTVLEFHQSGLTMATGSSTGLVHLYDLRSHAPYLKKDQGYGFPIHTLTYLTSSTASKGQTSEAKIMSVDKRIIKIWDEKDGTPWTSIEPAVDLNSVAWCKDSGMLLTANEGRQQHSFFIPQLGPAPKWCSFLDNLVEEMAEDPDDPNAFTSQRAGEVYDNYKFLTTQQLTSLNLAHLVGTTTLLRPYMHGYFVAQRLYEEAKLIANPFIWEEQRAKKVKEKIDSERDSRIRGSKRVTVKVNRRLAEKVLEREEQRDRREARQILREGNDSTKTGGSEKSEPSKSGLLHDPRFAKLFHDEEYAIDETSREFQSLNPSTKPEPKDASPKKLTAVEEEDLSDGRESTSSSEQEAKAVNAEDTGRISSFSYKRSGHRSQQMHVTSSKKPQQKRDRSFGSRAALTRKGRPHSSTVVGERVITFAPERTISAQGIKREEGRREEGRRSASGNVFRSL